MTPTTLYAGTVQFDSQPGVYKSTDGGGSWTGIFNSGVPDFVCSLLIDPTSPSTLYIAMGDTGVFKSTNAGDSWTALTSGLTNVNICALAIDPSTPTTLYAGGDDQGSPRVFKSTNGGDSWTPVNTGLGGASGISIITIDPTAPTTLYAGTFSGLFKSTNGGANWTAANRGLPPGQPHIGALVIDPSNSAILYESIHFLNGPAPFGLFKSTDGAGSWTAMDGDLSYTSVFALVIDPKTPTSLYAGTGGTSGRFNSGGVFKSTDGGNSWTAVLTGQSTIGPPLKRF